MSGDTRIERQLPQILTDLGAGASPDYTESLLARTAGTRQRPGWVFPERWLPMSAISQRMAEAPRLSWRVVAIVALLVLGLVSAALYVGSQQRRLPAPFGPAGNGGITYVVGGDLYVGDPVTGESRLLVQGPENDSSPLFSPDGTKVAFAREVGTTSVKPIDIYVVGEDGSGQTKVTPKPISDAISMVWKPDASGVAVVSKVDAGTNRVDVYDATGSLSVDTVLSAPAIDFVQFSPPDGRQILYKAMIGGAWGLYVLDLGASESEPVLLSSDPESDDFWGGATYSADGRQIYYTRPHEHETHTGTCCSLWVSNSDGSDQHLFIPNDGTAWDGAPVVSPDGSRVAFWHVGGSGAISVARTDGTGAVIRVGPELSDYAHWTWAPDSSKLLVIPTTDADNHAYLVNPDDGSWEAVPWQADGDFDWQRVALD